MKTCENKLYDNCSKCATLLDWVDKILCKMYNYFSDSWLNVEEQGKKFKSIVHEILIYFTAWFVKI